MIVVCPNCGARYKLDDSLTLGGKRMRCAECDHRWTLPHEFDDPVPDPVVVPEARSSAPLPTADPEITAAAGSDTGREESPEQQADDEPDLQRRFGWIGWALGLVLLLAAGLLAGGVALERIDPARVPVVGRWLAALQPGPSPLVITATANLTPLPSGTMLLEVSGSVRNNGRTSAKTSVLKATLETPGGVLRRWSIAVPAAPLAPGESVRFSSTLTDVPGGARTLKLVSG